MRTNRTQKKSNKRTIAWTPSPKISEQIENLNELDRKGYVYFNGTEERMIRRANKDAKISAAKERVLEPLKHYTGYYDLASTHYWVSYPYDNSPLILVHINSAYEDRFPKIRGLIIDLHHGERQVPEVIIGSQGIDEIKLVESISCDDEAITVANQSYKNSSDYYLSLYNEGVVIRVFKYNDQVYYASYKNLMAHQTFKSEHYNVLSEKTEIHTLMELWEETLLPKFVDKTDVVRKVEDMLFYGYTVDTSTETSDTLLVDETENSNYVYTTLLVHEIYSKVNTEPCENKIILLDVSPILGNDNLTSLPKPFRNTAAVDINKYFEIANGCIPGMSKQIASINPSLITLDDYEDDVTTINKAVCTSVRSDQAVIMSARDSISGKIKYTKTFELPEYYRKQQIRNITGKANITNPLICIFNIYELEYRSFQRVYVNKMRHEDINTGYDDILRVSFSGYENTMFNRADILGGISVNYGYLTGLSRNGVNYIKADDIRTLVGDEQFRNELNNIQQTPNIVNLPNAFANLLVSFSPYYQNMIINEKMFDSALNSFEDIKDYLFKRRNTQGNSRWFRIVRNRSIAIHTLRKLIGNTDKIDENMIIRISKAHKDLIDYSMLKKITDNDIISKIKELISDSEYNILYDIWIESRRFLAHGWRVIYYTGKK